MAEKGKEEEVAITNSEEKQAETIIVKVDAHNGETKNVTKQSLLDDRSRTGFAIGDRVNVLGKSDNKLYSGIIYDVLESQVELRWDDGDEGNRFHPFDVPKLMTAPPAPQSKPITTRESGEANNNEKEGEARPSTASSGKSLSGGIEVVANVNRK